MKQSVLEKTILLNLHKSAKDVNSLFANIDNTSKDQFYPTLSRLILDKKLCYSWKKTEEEFPKKYLVITRLGVKCLEQN